MRVVTHPEASPSIQRAPSRKHRPKVSKIRLKSFFSEDARLTLQFLPLIASVRCRLWWTPFPQLHLHWRALVQSELDRATVGRETGDFSTPPTPEERAIINEVWNCAHAVKRAARLVPRASCLTQAMTLQLLLARRGQPCSVCIGVDFGSANPRKKKADETEASQNAVDAAARAAALSNGMGRFEAHAWVEWRGRVILGGNVTRWKPLTVFAPAVFASNQVSTQSEKS